MKMQTRLDLNIDEVEQAIIEWHLKYKKILIKVDDLRPNLDTSNNDFIIFKGISILIEELPDPILPVDHSNDLNHLNEYM